MKTWIKVILAVLLSILIVATFLASSLFGFLHLSRETVMKLHGMGTVIMLVIPLILVFSIHKKDEQ